MAPREAGGREVYVEGGGRTARLTRAVSEEFPTDEDLWHRSYSRHLRKRPLNLSSLLNQVKLHNQAILVIQVYEDLLGSLRVPAVTFAVDDDFVLSYGLLNRAYNGQLFSRARRAWWTC